MDPVKVRLNAPMLIPVAGIVAGTLIALRGAGFLSGAVCILLAIILYELLGGYSNSPTKAFRLNKWHYSWVAILFVGAGIIAADLRRPAEIPDDRLQNTVMAHGHIAGIQHRTSGDRVTLDLTAIMDTAGRVYPLKNVRILGYADDVNAGIDDNIIFPCRLQRIVNSANSFDTGYADRMARQGILYSADMVSDSLRVTGHSSTVSGFFYNLRDRFVSTIENTMLSKDTQRFLITVLAGDKSFLDPDRRELYAGISHILALSGLHVSIIAGILLWILFPFNIVGLYQWRYAIAVPAIWLYAFITGLSPSTVRAAGMMTVMIACLLIERKNSPWNSLLLATFLILVFNPYYIFDIGLQLSFLCVASLIFFAPYLNTVDHHSHPLLYTVAAFLLASLCATIASWALSAYYFGIFPLLFIPANIVALPLLPIYMVLALIYLLSCVCGHPMAVLGHILDVMYHGLTRSLEWMGNGSATALNLNVSWITVALWIGAVALLVIWLHAGKKKSVLAAASMMAVAAIVLIPFNADADSDQKFILQSRADNVQILVKQGNDINTLRMATNTVSETRIGNTRIISADCPIAGTGSVPVATLTSGCDYLVVTRSCTDDVAVLDSIFKPRVLVIHPSVRRDREQLMLHHADSLGIAVHSLRFDGPIRKE